MMTSLARDAPSDKAAPEVPEAQGDSLKRVKSQLTTMLAENPQTQGFHDVFGGVPRQAKAQAETPPIETLTTSSGFDFAVKVLLTVLQALVLGYVSVVGVGFVLALINMASGSCGQEVWKTDASEACGKMITNTLMLSMEARCFDEKPVNMSQKDFDQACGDKGAMITACCWLAAVTAYWVWDSTMKLPVKANFHEEFFTVESWNGKNFEGSFYADVTHARVSTFGLKITSKAKVALNAGGGDNKKGKKGKTIKVEGDSILLVLAGSGAEKKKFLETFARYLPVAIDGFNGAVPPARASSSLLEGRMKEVLDARKANEGSFKAVRLPVTFDLVLEIVCVILITLVCWYLISRVFSAIGWAINKGQDKCLDPMRPEADMCAVWRIFVPVDVPLVNVSDYINLVLAIFGILAIPAYVVVSKGVEYRLHRNGVLQEVLLAGWEWQDNLFIFEDDVESFELSLGGIEKLVKGQVKATYTVKNGITKPFVVTARFQTNSYKMSLVDANCAACCGQRQKSKDHKEKLLSLIDEFKPGMLQSADFDARREGP